MSEHEAQTVSLLVVVVLVIVAFVIGMCVGWDMKGSLLKEQDRIHTR